jgi:DtxR family transcriptional regulator, Mn-dependent transcriptional regulator
MAQENYTHTEQNYIKAIYHLSQETDGTAYTQELAAAMSTTPASASDMVRKLSEKGLVSHIPYRGAKLNRKGEKAAMNIIRRHRLWELFLTEVLKFRWDEVHAMAEELEHVSSDLLLERIDEYLNYPRFDPHGDPIPDAQGRIAPLSSILLANLDTGTRTQIVAVRERSADLLKYLEKSGLILGTSITIVQRYDFDKSMDILINEKKQMHISNEVALNILTGNTE